MDLEVYTPEHRLELERLIDSPSWQRVIDSGLVEEVKSDGIEPNKVRNFIDTVLNQLLEFNEERVRKIAAEGVYRILALSKHCYVAPTQVTFTPDGEQYRCSSHAIRHILPIGNIKDGGVFDDIKAAISSPVALPQREHCYGCALATLHINQAVESKLKEKAKEIAALAVTTQ